MHASRLWIRLTTRVAAVRNRLASRTLELQAANMRKLSDPSIRATARR